ncbi:hypothetical protein AT1G05085 [Arabidopsis thaliana]|uniref:Uncharacterized protein n=1 Tax=Arabidopsis thaliana TaxID=3702 RepID=F4I792_ARATH|nr:uncharacterized protein AT1G05085 [Arabidopsis thaliana]AEE27789.1 hypothetical protein AT1G05085 [Arabidopsis thaliana]|eukprot:NP_973760.1 hypothetical protein AT1G05085 [Arabidopsis thaliana]
MVKPRWTADVRNIETCKWNKWSIVVNVILVNIRLKLTVIRGQKTNKIELGKKKKKESVERKSKSRGFIFCLLSRSQLWMFHPTWNLEGVLQYFLFKFTINGTCLLHPRFATCFPSRSLHHTSVD